MALMLWSAATALRPCRHSRPPSPLSSSSTFRMPRIDGLAVCRELRAVSDVPIVMLTGLEDEATAAAALDIGADDYVRKPFGVNELVARIRAILRRSGADATLDCDVLRAGEVAIDIQKREVTYRGQEVDSPAPSSASWSICCATRAAS